MLATRAFWDHAARRVAEIGDPRLTIRTVRALRERLPRHLVSVTVGFALRAAGPGPGADGGPGGGPARGRRPPGGWCGWCAKALPQGVVDCASRDAVRPAERTVRAACAAARDAVRADEGPPPHRSRGRCWTVPRSPCGWSGRCGGRRPALRGARRRGGGRGERVRRRPPPRGRAARTALDLLTRAAVLAHAPPPRDSSRTTSRPSAPPT
ncbi:hypothetical protein NKH77_30515 [Streptomyces sp. M19]